MALPIVRDRLDGDGGYTIDNWSYHSSGQAEYHGRAMKGTTNSQAGWLIERWTFDSNDRAETRKTSETSVIWDDRVSLIYS